TGCVYTTRLSIRNGKPATLTILVNLRRAGTQHPANPWGPCGISSATFFSSGGEAVITTPAPYWTDDASSCQNFPYCQVVVTGTTNYKRVHPLTKWRVRRHVS